MEFNPLPILILLVGIYFMFKLRFFFILHPIRTLSRAVRSLKDKRVLRSFALALAGTLGVGNVFGVAIGIIIGGAGSLFWLTVSMLFAMIIKYAEVVISSDNLYHDTETHGGFFYVIRASLKRFGRCMSLIYAAVTLSLSFVLGASLQINAVEHTVTSFVKISPLAVAIASIFVVFVCIIGGTNKIEKITSIIIPLTTIVYIIVAFMLIIPNFERIGEVVNRIVSSAFELESALGGVLGYFTSRSLREGFARGILSNEAGAGTSSMAHARSGVLSPASRGLLGILEVWFDTGLICLLTGFAILLTVPDVTVFDGGMELVMYAVGTQLGNIGKVAVLFCVFSFAFATVICWYYYGSESWSALFGKRKRAIFTPMFLLFVFLGCYFDSLLLVYVTDVLLAIATALTLVALVKNSDRIKALSESGGLIDSDRVRIRRLGIKANGFLKGEKRR